MEQNKFASNSNPLIPESLLKSLQPKTFDGRFRDARAKDWLVRFERYCKTTSIPETGQH